MANPLYSKTKISLLVAVMILTYSSTYAAIFTAVQSGDWTASATWGGTAPAFNNTTDQITVPVGITVNLDSNVVLKGALTTLTVNGTLTSTSTSLTDYAGTIAGAGTINIGNQVVLDSGAVLLYTGSLTTVYLLVGHGGISPIDVAANVTVSVQLNLGNGFNVASGGTLTMASNSIINVSGVALTTAGTGSLMLTNNYTVNYSGNVTAGLELSGSGLQNVTVLGIVTLTHDLTIPGNFWLSSGSLVLNGHDLTVNGILYPAGQGAAVVSTAASNISFISFNGIQGELSVSGSVNNLTVDVGTGNYAQIGNALLGGSFHVVGDLALTSGTLYITDANIALDGTISGSGNLGGGATSAALTVNIAGGITGLTFLHSAQTIGSLTVNVGAGNSVGLATRLSIADSLKFITGRIIIDSDITIETGGKIIGVAPTSYVQTGTGANLVFAMTPAAGNISFPIGTSALYTPAAVQLSPGSASGYVGISVASGVFSQGTTGTDLSITQPLVDATWFVETDISSNLNLNLGIGWNTSLEVNGFDHSAAYISHYTGGSWDASAAAAATAEGGGYFSLQRNGLTSLSPFAVFPGQITTAVAPVSTNDVQFEVHPNPAVSHLSVTNANVSSDPVKVEVVNMLGEVIAKYAFENSNLDIPVDGLTSGNYFIRLYNQNTSVVKKFVKM